MICSLFCFRKKAKDKLIERKKKRSKISAFESCYANRIYGTFGVEMRAYGHRRTGEHPFGGSNRVLPEWRKQLVCHAAPPGRKNNDELLQCLFLTVVDRYPRRLYPVADQQRGHWGPGPRPPSSRGPQILNKHFFWT